jgi:hypothetical protein
VFMVIPSVESISSQPSNDWSTNLNYRRITELSGPHQKVWAMTNKPSRKVQRVVF